MLIYGKEILWQTYINMLTYGKEQDRSNQKDLVAATIDAKFNLSKTYVGK